MSLVIFTSASAHAESGDVLCAPRVPQTSNPYTREAFYYDSIVQYTDKDGGDFIVDGREHGTAGYFKIIYESGTSSHSREQARAIALGKIKLLQKAGYCSQSNAPELDKDSYDGGVLYIRARDFCGLDGSQTGIIPGLPLPRE